jgi:hypothetical protein
MKKVLLGHKKSAGEDLKMANCETKTRQREDAQCRSHGSSRIRAGLRRTAGNRRQIMLEKHGLTALGTKDLVRQR